MKKILNLIGIISLTVTTSVPVLACNHGVAGTITFNIYKTSEQSTPSLVKKITAKADKSLADMMEPYAGKWFEWRKTAYGYFITSMDGKVADKNHYWSIHSPTNKKQCSGPKQSCLYGVSHLYLQNKVGIYNFYYTSTTVNKFLPSINKQILNYLIL